MKRKIENLINKKLDVSNNFEHINKYINYGNYENNGDFKEKKVVKFKFRYAIIMVLAFLTLGVLVDSISCNIYNREVDQRINNIFKQGDSDLLQVVNESDYDKALATEYNFNKKNTVLEKFFDGVLFPSNTLVGGGLSSEIDYDDIYETTNPGSSNESMENSYGTNVQTEGIDELDYSKCDGQYIYSLSGNSRELNELYVYNLSGKIVDSESVGYSYYGIYVKEEKIILVGSNNTKIYEFKDENLLLLSSFDYDYYNTSRLYGNQLIVISNNTLKKDEKEFDNMYHDGFVRPNRIYSIIKYDLASNTYNKVNNLNASSIQLYTSFNHIYLANRMYYRGEYFSTSITVVSIFDYDLEPVGVVRVLGTILNQFSMDEYNNYFRIVTTNTNGISGRLNSISIYDLNTLERVGYLDEGIGEEKQIVKSVRFSGETCYVVTYENTDPLYEINLIDVTNPKIVSIYKAPGYSSYLQEFTIDGQKYLFGIGVLDDLITRKISIYKDDGETTQIGKDYIIGFEFLDVEADIDLLVDVYNYDAFNNHKALFVHNDGSYLYLGLMVTAKDYYIFKIDVHSEQVVSIYKEYHFEDEFSHSRCYLINNQIYITISTQLFIDNWVQSI